ncbi:MAG: hypothetical protein UT32_C0018G0024 [Parcubacteria group bacterium GW2011_GWC2_39_14]|nr:MAG: hypothetical protein UT32_C0018G0024 [Parcubacteria group bacterium GW2011_GWC2_39_14]KKR54731.1 MAG: hypothetical protein UT91_C0010G0024 [Parcubacteria group bacterium GW2011_GWA2_40_23]
MFPSWKEIAISLFLVSLMLSILVGLHSISREKESTDTPLSAEACETALVYMDLHLDLEANPPGVNHSIQKDFDGVLLLRKQCQESSDRLALVKTYVTNERLAKLLENSWDATRELHQVVTTGEALMKQLPPQGKNFKEWHCEQCNQP